MVVNFTGGDGSHRILVARSDSAVTWSPIDGSLANGISSDFFTAMDQGGGNKVVYNGPGSSVTITGLKSTTTYYFIVYEYNSGTNNSQNYLTTSPGTGSQTTVVSPPVLSINPASLSFGSLVVNAISSEHTYILSGSNLNPASGNIIVTAPTGFEISTRSGVGFTSILSCPFNNGGIALTTIYVRFLPTAMQEYNENISQAGGGATIQLAVNGSGVGTMTGGDYFVSTSGNDDLNSGTIDLPFASIAKAMTAASAGDTIYVRGGTYNLAAVLNISKSGNSTHYYHLWAFPGERVDMNRSADSTSLTRGIQLSGSYWQIRGFDVHNAGDNGMNINGSHNIIEDCSFYRNNDSGLQLESGASYNQIINCDSYWNYDYQTNGGNADGFSPKLSVGTGNFFYGCRAWQNSDDGWDGYEAVATTTIENCWTFSNGYKEDGSDPGSQANGNGFKMGGNFTEHNQVLTKCLSFNNKLKGFDQNHDKGSMTLINCTGYNNVGNNYSISEALNTGKTLTLTNCAELGNKRSIGEFAILTTNSWPTFTVTAADFVSLDTAGVRGPRKADGGLPDITFMHLATGSQLISAGTYIGPGSSPDIGCFESNILTSVSNRSELSLSAAFQLRQNYPNPFNPTTMLQFSVVKKGMTKLTVVNILGQEIVVLFKGNAETGKTYSLQFHGESLPSGVYFSVLDSGGERQVKKMLLVK